jgi:hypothetical protein
MNDHLRSSNAKCPNYRGNNQRATQAERQTYNALNQSHIISQNIRINQVLPQIHLPRTQPRNISQALEEIAQNGQFELNGQSEQLNKNEYLNQFNSNKYGSLHDQTWTKNIIKEYHKGISELNQFYCSNCHEMWPTSSNLQQMELCSNCKKDRIIYSNENNMIPEIDSLPENVKEAFDQLTMMEEMLIAPICAVMSIFRLPGGGLIQRGYCANFKQELSPILKLLPRLPKDVPILVLKKKDQDNNVKNFNVNKNRVETVLKFLCNNNKYFIENGIQINNENLASLPENGIPQNLNEIVEESNVDSIIIDNGPEMQQQEIHNREAHAEMNQEPDEEYNTFVENNLDEPLQLDKIKNAIDWPNRNRNPINEYTYQGLCSLVFPKLFPTGAGDPTTKSRIKEVSETLAYSHLMKFVAHKPINNEKYYPFAEHPRFKFWAYDRLRRQRALNQSKVYMSQNPSDANLTISELKEIIGNNESNELMKRMSAYASNITGSDAYWYKRRNELESTFEQK